MGKVIFHPRLSCPSLADCLLIVKHHVADDTVSIAAKVFAIEAVSKMETHNCIAKAELIEALRFLFEHYDFEY